MQKYVLGLLILAFLATPALAETETKDTSKVKYHFHKYEDTYFPDTDTTIDHRERFDFEPGMDFYLKEDGKVYFPVTYGFNTQDWRVGARVKVNFDQVKDGGKKLWSWLNPRNWFKKDNG